MQRAAAVALLFAIVLTGCSTSPKLGKPTVFNVEEIRREFERLSRTYDYAGPMKLIGMSGGLDLHADGTLEYIDPSCTNHISVTVGTWHPVENRIEFDPGPPSPMPKTKIASTSSLRFSYGPINEYAPSDAPWLRSGLEVVGSGNFIALYPLDPALHREIARGRAVWPMRKTTAPRVVSRRLVPNA